MNKKIFILTFISFLIVSSGCGRLNDKVEIGKKVTIIYSAKFEDGNTFKDQEKLSFTIGDGKSIKALEDGILGLKENETKEISVKPENGYGKDYDPYKVQKISKIIFDRLAINPEIGKNYKIGNLEGIVKSSEGDGDYKIFMLDTNPKETYQNLIFNVKIEEIE